MVSGDLVDCLPMLDGSDGGRAARNSRERVGLELDEGAA